jgi:pyridoxine 5-phosphate synthase
MGFPQMAESRATNVNVPKLGVNIDHVATVRQARRATEPDPVIAAGLATLGGADVITLHLREDRRHVQDRDLDLLRKTVFTKLNLEMALADPIVAIALRTGPDQVTLVPEKRQELTTEGGLNATALKGRGGKAISRLSRAGIIVSIFVDPDSDQIKACADAGAAFVELHTGPYANARGAEQDKEFSKLMRAADVARQAGLRVNAGHGLNYVNVQPVAALLGAEELHIGHSIVARAVLVGMERAVREMKEAISRSCAEAG